MPTRRLPRQVPRPVKVPAADEPAALRRSLADVLDDLRAVQLRVVAGADALEAAVAGPAIFDPLDEDAVQAGDVVLAVGLDPAGPELARLVPHLQAAAAAALVVKADGEPPPSLVAAAEAAGLPLLAAPPTVPWGHLHTLLRSAAAVGARPRAEEGDVPIGNLFALADAIAAMVGAAVTIEDPGSRVLAYSSLAQPVDRAREESILGRQVSSEWVGRLVSAGVFRRLWQEEGPVAFDDAGYPGLRPRLAIAVRAGGEILGSLWAVQGDEPFGDRARTALRDAAGLAALHLIQHRSGEDLDRRRRSEALRALLEGRGTVSWAAGELGVPARTGAVVVALVGSETSGVEAAVRAQRTADLVALHCETYRRAAACVSVGATVYVLLPGAGGEEDRVRSLVETLVHRVHQALRFEVRAGISTVHPGLAAVAAARREADQAVRALDGDPRGRTVAGVDDVRARVVLRELAEVAERAPELTAGPLQTLAALDRDRGTAYVPTLRAYLDAFGDMAAAAARVNVHPNTFRYRVRRIAELSGLDLDDPDQRLVVELQLRFLERAGR